MFKNGFEKVAGPMGTAINMLGLSPSKAKSLRDLAAREITHRRNIMRYEKAQIPRNIRFAEERFAPVHAGFIGGGRLSVDVGVKGSPKSWTATNYDKSKKFGTSIKGGKDHLMEFKRYRF